MQALAVGLTTQLCQLHYSAPCHSHNWC